MRRRDLLKATPLLMTPALARADTRPLRFIPDANLSTLDPIWTTALIAQAHGYLVYDTLYGLDAARCVRKCALGTTSRRTSWTGHSRCATGCCSTTGTKSWRGTA